MAAIESASSFYGDFPANVFFSYGKKLLEKSGPEKDRNK